MDKPIFKMVRKRMVSTRLQGWRNNYVGQTYSAGLPWSSGFGRRKGSWRRSCSHLLLPCPEWIGAPPSRPRPGRLPGLTWWCSRPVESRNPLGQAEHR